jgi:RHS repeat-associated protein
MRYSILRVMAAAMRQLTSLAMTAVLAFFAAPSLAAPCAGFTDIESTDGFCANVAWLKNRSITLGCTSTTLYCPGATVNRLQMAAFMNRLGTALTPALLRKEDALASLDLDASPVVCQTSDFSADDFPRTAYADASFSATALADVGLAARLVMSLDGGASWSDLGLFASRGSVPAGQWGLLTDLGSSLLEIDQVARWGLRVSRDGAGADLGASRCHVRVRVFGRDDPPAANVAPTVNAGADQTITLPAQANLAAAVSDDGRPNPPAALTLTWSKVSGTGTVAFGNANAAQSTATFSLDGVYVLRLTASDSALAVADDVTITVNAQGTLPPAPETVATAPVPGVVADIADDTRFLYSGSNPIQTGVSPAAIDRLRAAVLRGRVVTRGGSALSGVAISVLDHPALGQTLSRADGRFDMAVNGGGVVTLNYARSGFIPVQRQVQAPIRDFSEVEEVVMISLDTAVTTIAANAPALQVHRGNVATDVNGARRPTLLFAAGTTATLVMPNGTTQSIASLDVRATEYTVGPDGPRAMPGPLPPASGYTYAVELSVDQAMAAGARTVQFSQPVVHYVENFLGFPVGGAVPTGFYDRARAAWIPSSNGRVIKITAIAGGIATVDTVGSGALAPLTLGSIERQQLASLYAVGQELWRVPIPHFSPWDCNWPYGPPEDAEAPDVSPPVEDDQIDDPTCSAGSIIECENQTLGERVAIVGTPFALTYRSTRVPGRSASRTLRIPLSGASLPASLKRIELDVQVAGRSFKQTLGKAANQQTSFAWDGLDAYGRKLQGAQPATVRVSYVYDAVYQNPENLLFAFGAFGSGGISNNRARGEISLSQSFRPMIGAFDARSVGLGGWTLSSHHVYDPSKRLLHQGDGTRRSAEGVGTAFEEMPRKFLAPQALTVGPDGSVYTGASFNNFDEVVRIFPDGTFTFLADEVEGPPSISIVTPSGVAVGLDGSVYVTEKFAHRIRRIRPDGTVTLVAGTGVEGFSGDGGAATQARLSQPHGIAIAADGTIYFADAGNDRLRRIRPDGIINTVAGGVAGCGLGPCGDGGNAKLAPLNIPQGVALGPDGSLYVTESLGTSRVRRIGIDGIITRVAGTGANGYSGDGGPAIEATLRFPHDVKVAADGTVYIADTFNGSVRRVSPDGIISTVAGTGLRVAAGPRAHGQAPTSVTLGRVEAVALTQDGTLYVSDEEGSQFLRLASPMRGVSLGDIAIPSVDGGLLYQFDSRGRHLRTLHALTGATLLAFDYDVAGLLKSVVEKTGGTDNVTTVERDAAGNPVAIVGPYGQRTVLGVDANGFLSSITNPAGEAIGLESTSSGLLTQFTDARGKTSAFAYDAEGRLTLDSDAVGGSQALSRTEGASAFSVARTTALGRTAVHAIEQLPDRIGRRTLTSPDGTQSFSDDDIDAGTQETTARDGTVTGIVRGPDSRFGMMVPIPKALSIAVPGGPTLTASSTETVELVNPADILSLISLTGASTVDGRTTTTSYTAATRTEVITTPAGRTDSMTLDTLGRPVHVQAGGLAPASVTYDARGRIDTVTRVGAGARTYAFAYNAQGFLATITDPIGRVIQWSYDGAGRVISKTFPDGRVVTFGYDASSNLTSLTPPGRPAHTFAYSDRGELTAATPPAVPGAGVSSFSYNLDGQYLTTARPDNRTVTVVYDAAGRRTSRSFATGGVTTGTDTLTYDAVGRVASIAAASGVATSYAYTGSLLTSENWTGATVGSVAVSYDTSFRLASQSVNGASTVNFGYDNDSLITSAGALTLTRDPQHGLATGSTLGVVVTTMSFNAFGEIVTHAASAGGTSLYNVAYVRDGVGRITQKTETLGGVTDTYVYTYDAVGQITLVTRNGAAVESYAYDTNGNRINATVAGVNAAGSYDAQDRVTSYGPTSFAHTAAGELSSKTTAGQTTTYQYDAIGNLVAVTLPGGTAIGYVVDGLDRRVGKRFNGTLVQGFLYGDALRPVAELDGAGALVGRFVYAGNHVPAYVIKGGVAHRIVTDHLGSVRLVVNTITGAVAQRIDYDTFGKVVADTSPGFQPFGFGGGIYDSATGLVRFGARDYDANIGRWTAKDPIRFLGGDANLYRYVRNNPLNRVDPSGKALKDEIARAESMLDDITDTYDTDFERNAEAGVEPTRRQVINELNRSTILDVIEKKKAQMRMQFNYVRNLFSGGLVSKGLFLLQALDFYGFACRAWQNGRSLFEQDEFEENQKIQNGTTTFVKCLGLVCYVDERI